MSCEVLDDLSRHWTDSPGDAQLPVLSLSERLGQQEVNVHSQAVVFLFVFLACFEKVLGHSNSCTACYVCDIYLSQGQADV